jgi:flagellar biosynthesis/type III secretory pathway protein FliH
MEETIEQMIERLLAEMRAGHEEMMAQVRAGHEEMMAQIAFLESQLDSYEAKIEANIEVLNILTSTKTGTETQPGTKGSQN